MIQLSSWATWAAESTVAGPPATMLMPKSVAACFQPASSASDQMLPVTKICPRNSNAFLGPLFMAFTTRPPAELAALPPDAALDAAPVAALAALDAVAAVAPAALDAAPVGLLAALTA